MNQKKIRPILIVLIMLLSLVIAAFPVQAGLHRVSGYLYIDGEIAPEDIDVNISFLLGNETGNTSATGHYQIDFLGHDFELGEFHVYYNDKWYIPTDNQTVWITFGARFIDLHIDTEQPANNPPNEPTLVAPKPSGTTGVSINADLSWNCSDPDGDPVTYDVYFGTTSPPPKKISNQSAKTYDPEAMDYEMTYYWKIVAWDDPGASTASPVWSFTTTDQPNRPPNKPNNPSPKDGATGISTSPTLSVDVSDPDGDPLAVYFYNAADDSSSIGNHSVPNGSTASFKWSGLSYSTTYSWYAIANDSLLTNTSDPWSFTTKAKSTGGDDDDYYHGDDDDDASDDDDDIIPNNPPENLEFKNYTTTGTKNTPYDYSARATDPDGHDIKYTFSWDDGTNNTVTAFYTNGTICDNVNHTWATAGVYEIYVSAMDDIYNASSGNTYLTVLIDALFVKNIGYLIDYEGDGTYGKFYSNETKEETTAELQENGTYLIDSDGTTGWDWIYDPETDTLEEYTQDEGEEIPEEDNTIIWYVGIGLLVIIVLIIIFLVIRRR